MAFSDAQLDQFALILEEAAEKEVMPAFGHLGKGAIRTKDGPTDLVTDADEASERLITERLLASFPDSIVIGEEAVAKGETNLDSLKDATLAFIIDPIDGTRNYAAATPLFGLIGAVVEKGEITAGVIIEPITQRRFCALKGKGAWSQLPDGERTPLKVAPPIPVDQMEIHLSTGFMPQELRDRVNSRLSHVGAVSMFLCSAHDYRLLGEGYRHGLMYYKLMPWDHAAGWLIHQEAGGYSAHFDGTPYRPYHTTGGILYAPDEASWKALHKELLAP